MATPWWGMQAPSKSDYTRVVSLMHGRKPAVAGFYSSAWSGGATGNYVPFPTGNGTFAFYHAEGVIPMWTWQLRDSAADPTADTRWNNDAILSGQHDAYIDSTLNSLKALGYEVRVRILHEFDGNWYPWGCLSGNNGNTGAKLKAIWIKIIQRARDLGVTNVKWVWCPDSRNLSNAADLDAAFPGADYIDYLSCDSYNFGPNGAHDWRFPADETRAPYGTVKGMFDQTQVWYSSNIARKNGGVGALLPVLIAETACSFAPAPPTDIDHGDKNDWITNHFKPYFEAWDQCVGVMWMQDQTRGNGLDDGTDRPADAQHPADTSGETLYQATLNWGPNTTLPQVRVGKPTVRIASKVRVGRPSITIITGNAKVRVNRPVVTVVASPSQVRVNKPLVTVTPAPLFAPQVRVSAPTVSVVTLAKKIRVGKPTVTVTPRVTTSVTMNPSAIASYGTSAFSALGTTWVFNGSAWVASLLETPTVVTTG